MGMSRRSVQGKVSPKGWREVKLKQNESQRSIRVNPSTKKLKDFLRAPVKNGFSPICVSQPTSKKVLGLGALTGSGLKLDETKWVSESNTEVDKFLIKRGDFLVSRSNTLDKVGRAAFYEGRLKNISYPDLMMKFRVDEKKIDPRFLELILQSCHARKHFMRHASGTSGSMVKITKSVVESLEVPLFSLGMQRSIVNLVFTWKEAIEKTERLIAASEKQFKWLLKKLISDQQNNLEWRKVRLGEIFGSQLIIEKGTPLKKEEMHKGDFPVIAGGQSYTYSHDKFTHDVDTITISSSGAYAGFVWFHDYPIFATDCNVIRVRSGHTKYFYYAIKMQQGRIYALQSGGAQPHIYAKDIATLLISIPPVIQQEQIANTLDIARQKIVLLKQLADQYRTQKRGLMQKLLTGE